MNLNSYLTAFTRINTKWIINLNVNFQMKIQEKNLGDIGFGEDFLDTTSKAQFIKENK